MEWRLVRRGLLVAWVAALSVQACGRSGPASEDVAPGFEVPLPWGPPATGPGVPVDVGDGSDGPLTVTSPMRLNTCHAVTIGTEGSLTLGATAGIVEGRRLLVWQVQDDVATASGDTSDVLSFGDAGRWEIVRVAAVDGSEAAVAPPLTVRYDSAGTRRAQACTVPEYTTVDVQPGGELQAGAWDGATGGVLALFASGGIHIAGTLRADGAGFRGGAPSGGTFSGNVVLEDTAATDGGGKGEGVDGRAYALFGRGNYANGGGGGNALNAGGGGGGNGGAGGRGGWQRVGAGAEGPRTAGRPGSRLEPGAAARLFAGGGGGAGHWNNTAGGGGGAGGGVIVVFASEIGGDGLVSARGADGLGGGNGGSGTDGGGGAGAGGTVFLRAAVPSVFSGNVDLRGGRGGDVLQSSGVDRGPGGGGSGGVLHLDGVELDGVVTLSGGDPGVVQNSGSSYNATRGAVGRIEAPQ